MVTLLFAVMIVSGILFIGSVLLMAPKGGLGFGVGGMATSNEYGSKKSLEGTLKKSAIISIVAFVISAILYPYAAKKELATNVSIANIKTQKVKLKPESLKIESLKTDSVKKEEKTTINKNEQENVKNNNSVGTKIENNSSKIINYTAPNGKVYKITILDNNSVYFIGADNTKHSFENLEKAKEYIDARNQKGATEIVHIAPNGKKYILYKKDGKIYFVNIKNQNQYFESLEKAKEYIDARNQR